MSRLDTMARFKEPDDVEPKPVVKCYYCTETLYEGDEVVDFEGEYLCDEDCFTSYMGIRKVTL